MLSSSYRFLLLNFFMNLIAYEATRVKRKTLGVERYNICCNESVRQKGVVRRHRHIEISSSDVQRELLTYLYIFSCRMGNNFIKLFL